MYMYSVVQCVSCSVIVSVAALKDEGTSAAQKSSECAVSSGVVLTDAIHRGHWFLLCASSLPCFRACLNTQSMTPPPCYGNRCVAMSIVMTLDECRSVTSGRTAVVSSSALYGIACLVELNCCLSFPPHSRHHHRHRSLTRPFSSFVHVFSFVFVVD